MKLVFATVSPPVMSSLLLVEKEGLRLQVEDRVYDLEDETMRTGG